jgi:DNA polymerase-1
VDTGESFGYHGNDIDSTFEPLYQADEIIGHNIIGYDLPVLKKLYGFNPRPGCRRTDTLVLSRLMHGNLAEKDSKRIGFPSKEIGSHSLRAWGLRLGVLKGDYGHSGDDAWTEWSPEMQEYMMQDLEVTYRLLRHLKPHDYSQVAIDLEHRVTEVCHEITEAGWPFDQKKAIDLLVRLTERRDTLERGLLERFGSWQEIDKVFVPKADNRRYGYTKGKEVTKYKTVVFNPGSRVHIEKKLKELGWKPEEFTKSGRAKLDEPILLKIDIPEAKDIVEYLLVQKRIGQISDGDNAWLKMLWDDGRIHSNYTSSGCITGRASHSSPNIAQVPSGSSPYGHECRELFTVPDGWRIVGADMSGLELRTLAHYLWTFDDGEYSRVLNEGDIHKFNQEAAGLPTRDNAKTFIYAWLYGAGDSKIGTIVNGTKEDGKKLKESFLQKIPAIGKLKKVVGRSCSKGYLKALDGRHIPVSVHSSYAALNYLLQGAGAILCKQWLVESYDKMCLRYTHGWDGDFVILGWIHDEIQVACREGLEDHVGNILTLCAKSAGVPFGFKVPLKSEYKIGNNWSQTH